MTLNSNFHFLIKNKFSIFRPFQNLEHHLVIMFNLFLSYDIASNPPNPVVKHFWILIP